MYYSKLNLVKLHPMISMESTTVRLVTFFLYPGYYFGLSVVHAQGMVDQSLLYYTLPVRMFLSILMLNIIIRNFQSVPWGKASTLGLVAFSYLYLAKIVYSEYTGWPMSKTWYEFIAYYVIYFLIPFFFFSSISFIKHKQNILNTLLFSGFLLGLISVYTFSEVLISGSVTRVSRWTFESEQSVISPLSLAYSGALILMVCIYKWIYEQNTTYSKVYIVSVGVFSLVLFYLGATRGALLAVLLSLIAFVYFGSFRHRFNFLFILTITIPIVLYGAERTGSSIFDRAMKTVEQGHTSGRDHLYKAAFDEFLGNPLLGGRIEVSGVYPHNLFLELLMGTGVAGALLFLTFMVSNLRRGLALASVNTIYMIPLLVFISAFSQHMVSFSIYGAMILAQPLGMFNSRGR